MYGYRTLLGVRDNSEMINISVLVGFLFYGCISYLPIYFQVIHGDTPTTSGLKLLPVMIGLLGTSIVSGLLITKTGTLFFKYLPITNQVISGHILSWVQSAYLWGVV
jgi:hypothetical protein